MSNPEPTAAEWREALAAEQALWIRSTPQGMIAHKALENARNGAVDRAAARVAREGGQSDEPAQAPRQLVRCPACDGGGFTRPVLANYDVDTQLATYTQEYCFTCGGTGLVSFDGQTVRRVKVEVETCQLQP